MKTLFVGLLALASFSALAGDYASLEYFCEFNGETRQGRVEIDERDNVGRASCMSFSVAPRLCFQFNSTSSRVDFSLRTMEQLTSGRGFISIMGTPMSEGASLKWPIKVGALKKQDLVCTFNNIIW
jgi:hypothetical protein